MSKGKNINTLFESLLFTDNTFGSLPELLEKGHKNSEKEWGYEADNLLLGEQKTPPSMTNFTNHD